MLSDPMSCGFREVRQKCTNAHEWDLADRSLEVNALGIQGQTGDDNVHPQMTKITLSIFEGPSP